MRLDAAGHAWKWHRNCSGHAVCPLCGTEKKSRAVRGKRALTTGFRLIGTRHWSPVRPRCSGRVALGRRILYRRGRLLVEKVAHDWPARLECRDTWGRKAVVHVLAYWRWRANKTLPSPLAGNGGGK